MNYSIDPIPNGFDGVLRAFFIGMIQDLPGIEQETISTLADGASTTVSHSEADGYSTTTIKKMLVQIFKSTGVKCTDDEVEIDLSTSATTITITNNSGAALSNLTVNMCFR